MTKNVSQERETRTIHSHAGTGTYITAFILEAT